MDTADGKNRFFYFHTGGGGGWLTFLLGIAPSVEPINDWNYERKVL